MRLGFEIAAVVLLLAFAWRRWKRRRVQDLGSVKPKWLNENVYERTGDDRQSK